MSTKRQRIAELARDAPDMAFTNLAHHIDIDWLLMAYLQTRKDGAVGVDGQTAADYEANLMGNLQALLDRAKSGTYVAPPVRRVHIPKAGSPGETRPLGIPTFEDKLLQRAVLMVLEPVYEADFLEVSHGFRPGRGAHGALDSLWKRAMNLGCCWIVDVDLRRFFDSIDHGHLREFLRRRVRDGVILRLIGKWLNAGVLEDGAVTTPEAGTPQGGVISPLLANIVLHYVLDEWFEKEVRPRLKGEAFLTRYADDFVIGLAREDDARRIMEVLPKRMSKYGLTVHPEKTRLVRFEPPEPDDSDTEDRGRTEPRTFDFLGFTHYWGRTQAGGWVIKRQTAKSRLRRALQALSAWCRANRHEAIEEQHRTLKQKLHGHFGYYGITGNYFSLQVFLEGSRRIWRQWLSRRRRGGPLSWFDFVRLEKRYPLPRARVVHSLMSHAAKS
ncbi:group II intron reverse transcriptase/maturase [Tundrisphaera lichenicola]|uniref:group II intron reverse transcriptase/maturase n=1 Tax=Tundrisphaera lichenicola TaxID=2029860 RepID=UPI003EBCA011